MSRTWASSLAVMIGVSGISACGSSTGGTAATGDGGALTTNPCAEFKEAVAYHAGLSEKSTGGTSVSIDDAVPAPPRIGQIAGKYNDWTISVTDSSGKPVTDATVTVDPYMPKHQHHSPLSPIVASNADGTYSATRIDFSMPGFWQTTVTVTTSGGTESVVFPLCIQ
jgi:hypothetical protein